MNNLTPKQNDIYQVIKRYYSTYGYFPTIREICELSGKSSTSTIKDHLNKLQRKGYIIWGGNARKSKIVL